MPTPIKAARSLSAAWAANANAVLLPLEILHVLFDGVACYILLFWLTEKKIKQLVHQIYTLTILWIIYIWQKSFDAMFTSTNLG